MPRPRLALTLGDPAGVGPRAALAAVRAPAVTAACEVALVGEASCWRRAGWRPGLAPLLDTRLGLTPPELGRPGAVSGRLSFAALHAACRLAARGLVDGLVTEPISKTAWAMAGVPYPAHTEFLRDFFDSPRAEMIIASPKEGIWCVLATRHVPLARAALRLNVREVVSAARALWAGLRRLGVARPALGLCALNPHGGEGGLLGSEEKRVLTPAVSQARRAGLRLEGPLPADSAWRLHRQGAFDGLVCLYHDQALIPLKVAAGLSGVNWTVGLPVVRTSPAHGTAFDAAKAGRVDASGTIEALLLAARLAARPRAR